MTPKAFSIKSRNTKFTGKPTEKIESHTVHKKSICNSYLNKGFESRIYKELSKLNCKIPITQLKKKIIFYLKVMMRERENFLHALTHSPNGCGSYIWASLQLGARNFLWMSHMGANTQALEPSTIAFPSHIQETGWNMEQSGLQQVAIWDASAG